VQVATILGSCVAVCLFDPEARLGGMNHFLLPEGRPASPRFADHAVPLLVARVLELGASRPRLQAKVFGGSNVLEALRHSSVLAARNVDAARERLALERIPIVAEDVGGVLGRKLVFDVQTGSAWVRVITVNG
jgi:chemotaxis protein CheD